MLLTIGRKPPFIRARRGIIDNKGLPYRAFEKAYLSHVARLKRSSQAQLPDFKVAVAEQRGLKMAIPEFGSEATLERRFKTGNAIDLRSVFLRHQWADGGALIDVGANIGLTTLPHAVFGGFGQIISIEPEPRNLACLRYNIDSNLLNGKVKPLPFGVGAASGTARLRVSDKIGCHRIGDGTSGTKRSIEVQVRTLDEITNQQGVQVSLVKCDTQGHEVHVLSGAQSLLRERKAAWHIEVWPAGIVSAGASVSDLTKLVQDHFDWFAECRFERPQILAADRFEDFMNGFEKDKAADLILIP